MCLPPRLQGFQFHGLVRMGIADSNKIRSAFHRTNKQQQDPPTGLVAEPVAGGGGGGAVTMTTTAAAATASASPQLARYVWTCRAHSQLHHNCTIHGILIISKHMYLPAA